MNKVKYTIAFLPFVGLFEAINLTGWYAWTSAFYLVILLPILEILIGENKNNHTEKKFSQLSKETWYDYLLYIVVPLQYFFLFYYLHHISYHELTTLDYFGNITSMGILCGTIGINVAHELGHRANRVERFLSKSLLLTTSYLHFYIEHNRGHHKNVGTPNDPASARYGENLYFFWVRSVVNSYFSAWQIANNTLRKNGLKIFSIKNEMIQYQMIQLILIILIFSIFGLKGTVGFILSSLIGILLLETINYIQHYGLCRKLNKDGRSFEQVIPIHSWNSAFPVGRILLFELGRHSDHHYRANKKYQTLLHNEKSPQMPTGYTGMIVLSLIPPLWFFIMNPLVKKYSAL